MSNTTTNTPSNQNSNGNANSNEHFEHCDVDEETWEYLLLQQEERREEKRTKDMVEQEELEAYNKQMKAQGKHIATSFEDYLIESGQHDRAYRWIENDNWGERDIFGSY